MLTALENLSTPLLAILTVDMPQIEAMHLNWLIRSIQDRSDLHVLMPGRLVGGKVQVEPFPSAWRAASLDMVRSQIAKENASVRALAKINGGACILAPRDWPASVWTNLNTPEDLEKFVDSHRSPTQR